MGASRTFVNASWSLQRADHGEQPFWMAVTLAAMLGRIGTPGGGLGIGYGSVNAEGSWATPYSGPVLPQLNNAVKSFIPVARISDMLLHPRTRFDYDGKSHVYPDIRLVYWCGGNPFHHHQDLNRLIEAWRRPDTIVVHDHYWTAAAKHADVVLPATTMLERDDVGSAGRDRYMIAMKKAVDAPGEARDDFAIFADLAERLDAKRAYTEDRDVAGWLRHLYEASREKAGLYEIELPAFEDFWRQGWFEAPRPPEPQVCLDRFPRRSKGFPARHAFRKDRDLLRAHRLVRLRRLPGPSGVAGARRVAGIAGGRALPAAPHFQPAAHQAAQPVRSRRGEPRQQDSGPRADRHASG
jgi:biotin/methionine sulfoxide reductase